MMDKRLNRTPSNLSPYSLVSTPALSAFFHSLKRVFGMRDQDGSRRVMVS